MKLYEFFLKLFYKLTYRFRSTRIDVNQAKLSGDNSFIDIRYWLSRPDKIQCNLPIYLMDESSGMKLGLMNIAKFGYIHTKHSKHQHSGILLFYNRNHVVNHGSRITLHFGELVANSIIIK